MTTTMHPPVQNLSPAPTKPAPKKQAGPADASQPSATDFRQELGRKQKSKRPEDRDSSGARAAKSQKGKRSGSTSGAKHSERVDESAPQEAGTAADDSASPGDLEHPIDRAEPVTQASHTKPEKAGAGDEHDEPDALSPEMAAATVAVPAETPVRNMTGADTGGEVPTDPGGASRLVATEPVAEAVQQAVAAPENQLDEANDPPQSPAVRRAAPADPAFSRDTAPETTHPSRHATADGERGQQQPWMPDASAVAAVQPTDPPGQDVEPKSTMDVRAGAIDASTLPTVDLSAKHQSGLLSVHAPSLPQQDAPTAELRFAADNHENIVKGMRADLLPNGGSMRIKLDPPQLGALQVTVQIRDGVVTAAFETSNDEATRLLGHSLNQLKSVLESHGISVDKLQVQQSPRDERTATGGEDQHRREQSGGYEQEHAASQEQQRREMLRKMWRRLSGVADPLDVTG